MDMSGQLTIAAPRDRVWDALNDEKILQDAVPGCQEVVRVDETHFTAKVKQKIGPISASFSVKIELSDLDPPQGYKISGSGDGGAVGFAKGGASVSLVEVDGQTTLSYEVQAQVGGKIAQLGARLIDSAARKLAAQFFRDFKQAVEAAQFFRDFKQAIETANAVAPTPSTPAAPMAAVSNAAPATPADAPPPTSAHPAKAQKTLLRWPGAPSGGVRLLYFAIIVAVVALVTWLLTTQ
ncbi:MAG: carbon monoxide dehydrogenase subunit G [Pseudomonadota bacterium]